jgi:O-antigen chain-terminating methyltransferase
MSPPDDRSSDPRIESLASGENRELSDWRWLWEGDREFGVRSHRRFIGPIIVAFKRFVRALTRGPQHDLWERQRRFNLLIQDYLETTAELREAQPRLIARQDDVEAAAHAVASDLQTVQKELLRDLEDLRQSLRKEIEQVYGDMTTLRDTHLEYLQDHAQRTEVLEGFMSSGVDDLRLHVATLFARADQKFDAYRRRSQELFGRLQSLLAVAESGDPTPLARAVEEQGYVELERLFRGSEKEIGRRLEPYLGYLEGKAPVLDLGCGRGEALALLVGHGVDARGVDSSAEMVEQCREKGLVAEVGDLFEALAGEPEASLGGVVSFHVIEHLPPDSLERLVKLAWRALRPGGVLALETPSPLSLMVSARNFWIDPTHKRPVHPDSLKLSFELAGFDPVFRLDLQPFADDLRLSEISSERLPTNQVELVERVNRLRDELDALLFGYQDFGMVGFKPALDRATS